MGENRSLLTALGALAGLVIFVFVLMTAVNQFQAGADEFREQQRVLGEPVTLAQTIRGEVASGETITATEGLTATAAMTESAAVTETAPVTESAAVTETSAVAESAPLTATTEVTATTATTAAVAAESSAAVTETAPVTATTPVSEAVAVAEVEPTAEPTAEPTVEPTVEPTTAPEPAPAAVAAVPAPADVEPIVTKAGCIGCHVIPGIPAAVGAIGPNLTDIGVNAATRVPGLSATEYLHQSLLEPNAFIAPECPTGPCLPGLMIQNLGDLLTPEEIDLVVAYLASLGSN
jgi:hypothetical protein